MDRRKGVARLSSITNKKNSKDFIVMHYLIADLKDAIQEYARGEVLDVGCGNKPYEVLFTETTELYIGCDVVQSSEEKVDVICHATELSFENNRFDTVFTTQVIEHVGDPFKMSEELFRVLKPGGFVIMSAPFTWELHEEPYDFFRYTKYGLNEMLSKVGFDVLNVKANGGKWAALIQIFLNMIYSTFRRKTFIRRCLKFIFINCRCTALINQFALYIDKTFHDELLTLNYVVVAKKV